MPIKFLAFISQKLITYQIKAFFITFPTEEMLTRWDLFLLALKHKKQINFDAMDIYRTQPHSKSHSC